MRRSSIKRPPRVPKDYDYLAFIRAQPCVLADQEPCECLGFLRVNNRHFASDPCHLKSRGAGGGERGNLFPACRRHHAESHQIGIKSFQQRYGLDLRQIAADLTEQYERDHAWSLGVQLEVEK